ncbi:D-alanyl-D-alanine carboxypeptidase family protein [Paenibacillus sp. GXUN7292]|uniref:D-alanyl-D-alanine carboxypeptidase family protein n=1 Tax=Paenibacillus sp. GXUN7292 TaxID=3422499 RepID=UPI003D7CB006
MEVVDTKEIVIRLKHSDIYKGHLLLVNKDHPIRCLKQDLRPVPRAHIHKSEQLRMMYLEAECLQQLLALLQACHALDDISAVSCFRSSSEQHELYKAAAAERGELFAASYVARPHESEHQTGLAVDVGLSKEEVDYICPSFPDEGKSAIFKRLAAKYGFVQRYKESKTSITRISCEPWHYRYVGIPHAMLMEKQDFCLEEYILYLKQFESNQKHLFIEQGSCIYEIYYIASTGAETEVMIPEQVSYATSGNNVDGFIVTIAHWKRQ